MNLHLSNSDSISTDDNNEQELNVLSSLAFLVALLLAFAVNADGSETTPSQVTSSTWNVTVGQGGRLRTVKSPRRRLEGLRTKISDSKSGDNKTRRLTVKGSKSKGTKSTMISERVAVRTCRRVRV